MAVPAIDLREGACVQLVGGSFDAERVRVPDPVEQARTFQSMGFRRLHVVDLDAATGRGENGRVIDALLGLPGLSLSIGGGIRTKERAVDLVGRGADKVVVGTRGVEDPDFLANLASALPGRVVLALDVRGREVLSRGWAAGTAKTIFELLPAVSELELGGVLVTAVHVEGTMAGVDADLIRDVVAATRHPVIASGGIGSLADLRLLASIGASSAVIGMALYTGAIDGAAVAREFGS